MVILRLLEARDNDKIIKSIVTKEKALVAEEQSTLHSSNAGGLACILPVSNNPRKDQKLQVKIENFIQQKHLKEWH